MILFPNCKINLGLKILQKRKDGYHDIETVFYPLPFKDALEITRDPVLHSRNNIQFQQTGLVFNEMSDNNVCIKAYYLLKKEFPDLPAVKIHLHKTIPIGAGLGGGSADAAFLLKLLDESFDLNLSEQQLLGYALRLGSDCPFFIINKSCEATGRGELLNPIQLNLSNYRFLIVYPGIRISTSWAFSELEISEGFKIRETFNIIKQPIETWKTYLKNDFEELVFNHYPQIRKIKDRLYNAGAIYSSMSGSGSTIYGIFEKDQDEEISFPASYLVKSISQT